ncbi:disulfide bond formation protein B [Photorhabdus heterorhabditis]|uniref:Disulfide bond formation protein n=1 Tax=Photorhabdus heterorhabditis TaxID=880156 RepID=A0A5B0X9N8_9GAMM|nr:disulfide bond formation protein B [Photorhabdus heterorhabditis]KAA1195167.1 disulfide bond formation protein B [Photorhabdus heterorhabditis]KOY63308.1 disulfide bond formation protein [Photorhabdus heterorhabditis]MBS9440253.1 disulfide bond formation protein B [Photorhabdus heterorhabditis]
MNQVLATKQKISYGTIFNIIGLFGISAALTVAFYYQLVLSELPCPLCLLQRTGMIMIGFGFLFNLRFGIKSAHYGIALIGCIVTGIIAIRQVFLHIMPGDTGYGSALFGLHFYTWALLSSIIAIIAISVMLILKSLEKTTEEKENAPVFGQILIGLFVLLIAANLISTVLECGGGQCDDNPTFYQLLGK